MSPDALRAWHEDYLEACNRRDVERIRELVHPDVHRAHLPRGADAWIADLVEVWTAFPDYQEKRIRLIVEDDRIAAHLRGRGTQRGAFRGLAATGRHVNVAEFALYRVEGGRITEYAGTAFAELVAQVRP